MKKQQFAQDGFHTLLESTWAYVLFIFAMCNAFDIIFNINFNPHFCSASADAASIMLQRVLYIAQLDVAR